VKTCKKTLRDYLYHEEDAGVIYCGDCLEILPLITEKVDLVLTDPPYGIDGARGGQARINDRKYHTDKFADTPEYIKSLVVPVIEMCIASSRTVIVTPGTRCLKLYPDWNDMGCLWCPAAPTHGPFGFTNFQPVLYYGKDPRAGRCSLPTGYQMTESASPNGHVCPKPLKTWTKLLHKGTLEHGEIVLDPFLGSGTTAVAAKQLGRKFIGIEIEPKYCQIAVEWLRQEVLPL